MSNIPMILNHNKKDFYFWVICRSHLLNQDKIPGRWWDRWSLRLNPGTAGTRCLSFCRSMLCVWSMTAWKRGCVVCLTWPNTTRSVSGCRPPWFSRPVWHQPLARRTENTCCEYFCNLTFFPRTSEWLTKRQKHNASCHILVFLSSLFLQCRAQSHF